MMAVAGKNVLAFCGKPRNIKTVLPLPPTITFELVEALRPCLNEQYSSGLFVIRIIN